MNTRPPDSLPLIHPKLLDTLLSQQGKAITMHALALAAGLSIDQTQHELSRLAITGCVLDHHPQLGVTLTNTGCGAWVDYLQWSLGIHRPVIVYRQTPSTQDAAKQLLAQKSAAANGSIILADQQYAGRGRLGRTWLAPPGSAATFSLIHVSKAQSAKSAMSTDRLIFASAVAVARGIESAVKGRIQAQIKWPNDVLIAGKKTAGILVETITLNDGRIAAIIGVGINVSSTPDLAQVDPQRGLRLATSLADHMPVCGSEQSQSLDRLHVMNHVLRELDQALAMNDPSPLVEDWRARSVLLSQAIALQTPEGIVQGDVIDLDPYEGLIIRTAGGEILHLPAATTSVV